MVKRCRQGNIKELLVGIYIFLIKSYDNYYVT